MNHVTRAMNHATEALHGGLTKRMMDCRIINISYFARSSSVGSMQRQSPEFQSIYYMDTIQATG